MTDFLILVGPRWSRVLMTRDHPTKTSRKNFQEKDPGAEIRKKSRKAAQNPRMERRHWKGLMKSSERGLVELQSMTDLPTKPYQSSPQGEDPIRSCPRWSTSRETCIG